jgi:hypothetical protein
MQKKSPIKNENGSVIILALIFLVLLTIIGMSAVDTSTIEVQISGNDVRYKTNLYRAEGAVMECAQIIETETNPSFLHPAGTNAPSWIYANNVYDLSDSDIMAARATAGELGVSNVHPNASYGVVALGIGYGDSLDITAPSQMNEYAIYGLYSGNDGQSHIVVGYKKRF